MTAVLSKNAILQRLDAQYLSLPEKCRSGLEDHLQRLIDSTLVERIGQAINQIQQDIPLACEGPVRNTAYAEYFSAIYPTIDTAFLKTPGKKMNVPESHSHEIWGSVHPPLFAVHPIDASATAILEVETKERGVNFAYKPAIHRVLSEPLLDFLHGQSQALQGISYYRSPLMRTEFKGIVPASVKDVIRAVRPAFLDDLYLVVEADWHMEIMQPKPKTDPLLIGVVDNKTFLLAAFDTTSAEEHVRRAYTRRKPAGKYVP